MIVIYEIEINNKSIHPMQQTWKTAWTSVPFTFIMFIPLVDVRHLQNCIVMHFLTLFWRPLCSSALDSHLVCLNV